MRNYLCSIPALVLRTGTMLLVLGLISSCSHKMGFMQSSVVPAAEGSVKVKKDNNKNYKISLSIVNLAPPENLQPPHSNYIVWVETAQNGLKNIGRLTTSSGLFSKVLKADLEAVTAFKPTRIFITAEDDAAIQYPNSTIVLSTETFNK